VPPIRAARAREAFRALAHRNFRLFAFGQLVSLVGTWMQTVAESWLVYRLTGSSLLLGAVGFASQIPVFLLATAGGAVADRGNRHRILIATQTSAMLLAGIYAVLTLTHRIRVPHVFVLAALLGVVNAFDIPTRQAFVRDMVGREDLMNAIALNSSMFNGARVVGPAVAGLLVASVGEGWCFAINSASYIAVIGGLLAMKLPPFARKETAASLAELLGGFRFVASAAPVKALLLLVGVLSFCGMPYAVLMPVFSDQILHSGARGLGMLMAASGCGALVGSLLLAARRGISGLGTWVAVAGVTFGLSAIAFSFSRSLVLSVVLLVPVGMSLMVQMASTNTLIQAMVPDELRGRVMAVYSMMFMGMAPFGSMVAGVVAEHLGAPTAVAAGGSVCVLGALLFRASLPRLREEGRKLVAAQA
jgi:MFS family permease